INSKSVDAENNLGLVLLCLGKLDEAEPRFRAAIEVKPDAAVAWNNLGTVLALMGKKDQAVGYFTQAVRLEPQVGRYHYLLAHVLREVGQGEASRASYEQARKIEPTWPASANLATWKFATHPDSRQRSWPLAVRQGETINEATGENNPDYLDTLA